MVFCSISRLFILYVEQYHPLATSRMSLCLWKSDGKMSLTDKANVAEIVKKYKERFSSDPRPDLRRRIRTENPNMFKDSPEINVRKLDRYLRKEFKAKSGFENDARLKTVSKNTGSTEVVPSFSETIGISEKQYCTKCDKLILERLHTGGPPTIQKINCPSCGFENDISKASAKPDGPPQQITKQEQGPRGFTEDTGEDDQLIKAIEELRKDELKFFRDPSINEIAVKVKMDPKDVEYFLDRFGWKLHWKKWNHSDAAREARELLELAGLLLWKNKEERDASLSAYFTCAINDATSVGLLPEDKIFSRTIPNLSLKSNISIQLSVLYQTNVQMAKDWFCRYLRTLHFLQKISRK